MTPVETARAALTSGDAVAALAALEPALRAPAPPDEAHALAARALRRLERHAEAAAHLRIASGHQPGNGVLAHNLAAALGDAGDHEGAIAAARRAIALRDAPESWLVLGRALQAAGDLADAESAFAGCVARRPGYLDALKALSQLTWMRTGDADAAVAPLRDALASTPSSDLAALVCGVIKDVAGPQTAYDFIDGWAGPRNAAVELASAAAATWLDGARQVHHARAALEMAPDLPEAWHGWITALLAQGRIDQALAAAQAWLARAPRDQVALGLQRTAWRLGGRPEALDDGDYRRLARAYDVETPAGWPSRQAWLGELGEALRRLHSFRAEPFGQSVRAGAQSRMDPRQAGDPVINATFAAFAAPLAAYVRDLDSSEPAGARGASDAVIAGAWSVKLASGGSHNDHVHPRGWISSAFYVSVPDRIASEPRGGWLRFGATHLGPRVDVPAEHWIEPKPGRLALFPSYMWHGTEPFSGAGERLTIAFDAQPVGARRTTDAARS